MPSDTPDLRDILDRIAEHLVSQETGDVSRALLVAAMEEIERLREDLE